MRVRNFRLEGANGNLVPLKSTPNKDGALSGGKPKALVMHYTSGGTASGAIDWFQNASAEASAHLVIGHNGDITQMGHFNEKLWHAGTSRWRGVTGLNSHSVGIEIVNWGKLRRTASGSFVSRTGKPIPSDRVVLEEHKHFPGKTEAWEIFDEAQIEAALGAAKAIVKEYKIEPWNLIGHDDISPRRKIDPGPVFDMDWFRETVFGRSEDQWNDDLYRVQSTSGLNLRVDPGVGSKLIKNLADGTIVHAVEKNGNWWLVAEVIQGGDDVTGFVHRNWLEPV